MAIDNFQKFSAPAATLWESIPNHTRQLLISSIWCGRCRHDVTITNFTGAVKSGNLLLVGLCSDCHGDIAREIEMARVSASGT